MQKSVAVQAQVAFSFIPTDSASALGKAKAHSPVIACTPQRYMWGLLQMESMHLSLAVIKIISEGSYLFFFGPFNVTARSTAEFLLLNGMQMSNTTV